MAFDRAPLRSAAEAVFITGASGFIGRRLRDSLLEAGREVTSLLRAGSPKTERGRSAIVDYNDTQSLAELFAKERPRYIFHVAGVTKGVTYGDFQRGNVLPTKNLLEAVKRAGIELDRFVHVSSLASYGPSAPDRPHHESHDRHPIEFYGRSKLEAEQIVESFASEIPATIIRPGGVYGPGDIDFFELFKSVHRGFNVFFGNRERFVSLVYVDDLIRAIIECAQSETTRGKGYFICDGTPVSFDAFQRVIVRASGRKVRDLDFPELLVSIAALGGELLTGIDGKPRLFNRQKAIMGKQAAWTCTHASARADFNYAATVPLTDGVKRTYEWYRAQGWLS